VVSTCCGDGILDAGEDCEPTGELGPYCRPDCRFLPFASEVLATKPKVHGQTVDQAPLVVTADSSFVVAEASGVASTVGPAPGGLAGDNVTSASLVALDAESWLAGWVSGSQTPVAHQVSSLDGSTIATANFWFSFPEASWIGTGSAGSAVATIHRPSDAGTCGSWTDVLEIQRWIPGGEKETLASYSGHMPHYKNVCYQEPFTLKNVASAIDATGAVAWATHLFRAGNLYSERLRAGLAGSPSGPDVEVELQLPVALVPTAWNSYPSGVESRGFGVGIDGFGGAVVYILVNDLHRVYRIDTSIEPTAVTSRDFVEWGMPGTVQYSFASPQLVPGVDDGLIHFVVPIQSRSGIALFYVRLTHELDVEVVAPISRVCQPSSDQAWRVSPAQDGVFWVLTRALCDGSDTVERVMLPFRLP
jgi:hypothetical protein